MRGVPLLACPAVSLAAFVLRTAGWASGGTHHTSHYRLSEPIVLQPMRRRVIAGRPPLALGLRFRLDYLTAHVVAAIRTNHVRRHRRAALRAIHDFPGFYGIVRPAGAGARIIMLAFWNGHRFTQDLQKNWL